MIDRVNVSIGHVVSCSVHGSTPHSTDHIRRGISFVQFHLGLIPVRQMSICKLRGPLTHQTSVQLHVFVVTQNIVNHVSLHEEGQVSGA